MNPRASLFRALVCLPPLALSVSSSAQFAFTEVTGTPFEDLAFCGSAFGDVNNDGRPDLVIAGARYGLNPVTDLHINLGNGSFGPAIALGGSANVRVTNAAVAMADVDDDDDLDVLVTGMEGTMGQPRACLYINEGTVNGNTLWTLLDEQATHFVGVERGSITFETSRKVTGL